MISQPDLLAAAQDSFSRCNGNRKEFETLFRADRRVCSLSPIVVMLLVRLALILFDYWMSQRDAGGFPPHFQGEYQQACWALEGKEDGGRIS